jgi:hypothetical protein
MLLKYLWKHPVSYVQAVRVPSCLFSDTPNLITPITQESSAPAGSNSPVPGTAKAQWGSGPPQDAPALPNNAPTKSWGTPGQSGRDTGSSWGSNGPAQQQQQVMRKTKEKRRERVLFFFFRLPLSLSLSLSRSLSLALSLSLFLSLFVLILFRLLFMDR